MELSITKHGIDLISKSPLDYWNAYINPNREPYKESEHSAFDKALRMAIFNRTSFDVIYSKYKKKQGKRTQLEIMEHNNLIQVTAAMGQELISSDDYDTVLNIKAALLNHPLASGFIKLASPGSYSSFDSDGVSVSFTPHAFFDKTIINLTSTTDVSESNFQKEANMYNWHKKEAIQIDGSEATNMLFITCEKKYPYNIGLFMLDERSVTYGRESYKESIQKLKECAALNVWPGVSPKVKITSLPEWAFKK